MNVLIFGGTGLLGSAAAQIFIDRGHHVKTIALPPLPEGAPIPKEMEIEFGNFLELSDEQLEAAMTGMDAFVYAAGVDERVEFPAPVYDAYKKYNIDPVDRCLAMAKKCGVKRCVVLGSYFSWLAKTHPEMDLCAKHPYIRSRIDQEKVAAKYADENMGVGVLELQNGSIEALAVAKGNAEMIIDSNPDLMICPWEFEVAAEYEANVILITKGETALLNVVNEALAKAYADGLYGTWYEDAVALAKSENAAEVSVED